jgi:hypothetical protein
MIRIAETVAIFGLPGHQLIFRPVPYREEHSPLSINTAVFGRVLVMFFAGLALCFGEGNNFALQQMNTQSRRGSTSRRQ